MSMPHIHYRRIRGKDTGARPLGTLVEYDPDVSSHRVRGLPFDAASVGLEIETQRARLQISVTAITSKLGMTRTAWYTKVRGTPPFRWEEAAAIAKEFQAPRGWPLVPWHEGEAWEAWLRGDKT